jgi:hypothetical protein
LPGKRGKIPEAPGEVQSIGTVWLTVLEEEDFITDIIFFLNFPLLILFAAISV